MSAYNTHPEGRTDTKHATVVEEGLRWKGPFTEYDKYGEPTGERFVRCTGWGVEVLAGDTRPTAMGATAVLNNNESTIIHDKQHNSLYE